MNVYMGLKLKQQMRNNMPAIQPDALALTSNYLSRLSSSASSSVHPWVQPEKANMSISYLRCNAKNVPFCWRMRTNFCPKASIAGVNLSAWKFTRHLSLCRSREIPLFASRVSVLFKCITLYLEYRGRICMSNERISLIQLLKKQEVKSIMRQLKI